MSKNPNQSTFKRYEKKYLLSSQQYEQLMSRLGEKITADEYCKSTICNIYYDTPNFQLIRASIESPVYKEKLRVRSYGVASENSKVFVEIKKKYKGVVYKRRENMLLRECENYLNNGISPARSSQIFNEIDWFIQSYQSLAPAMHLSYNREAYAAKENSGLRFTFDTDILWRCSELSLCAGIGGNPLLEDGQHLMEIKIPGAMPVWLAELLCELKIYKSSFSKYGNAYKQLITNNNNYMTERNINCA